MGLIRILVGLTLAHTLPAGILITRSGQGLQFSQAESLLVQGKDKALSLGKEAKLSGPVGKLTSVPLNGTILVDSSSGTPALYHNGALEFLLPAGLPKTAAGDLAALWKAARIVFKKSASDKAPAEVPDRLVAFLPGGPEDLAAMCADETAMAVLGGQNKTLSSQLELVAAAVRAFPAEPGIAALEKWTAQSMHSRLANIESGMAGAPVLNEAIEVAALSQAVYAAQPEQQRLRTAIASRKAWLDRKRATLRAFAAAGDWDSLIAAARETEVYEQAFPEFLAQRTEALRQSLELHRKAGRDRVVEGEYGAAYREFRRALSRQSSDAALNEEARLAWAEYSRRAAVDRQGMRESLSAGARDSVERDLYFADQNLRTKNLEEAFVNVQHAESTMAKTLPGGRVATESLKVLLKKSEILAAQGRTAEALDALSQYDLVAVGDERQPANLLRNRLMFELEKLQKARKDEIRQAWAASRFHRALALCLDGLRAAGDDPELLYRAGIASLITRREKEARPLLARYLDVSGTLEGDAAQRAAVRRLLSAARAAEAAAAAGAPNWLSGFPLPAGSFYCPVSLAFQPRIDHIDASGRLRVDFQWDKGLLQSITPVFDKNDKPTGEKKISFAYDERVPQVAATAIDQETPTWSASDPDDAWLRSALVLLNNPYVDPAAAGRFTGKNLTLAIAGNRFFNPFVWEKLHYFQLTYDENGRVSAARELAEPGGPATGLVLELDWKDLQLTAIRGYEGPDEAHRTRVYERRMLYRDGRLISEDVSLQGRTARITYVYRGDRLLSATCDKNSHSDGRSRQVTFTSN